MTDFMSGLLGFMLTLATLAVYWWLGYRQSSFRQMILCFILAAICGAFAFHLPVGMMSGVYTIVGIMHMSEWMNRRTPVNAIMTESPPVRTIVIEDTVSYDDDDDGKALIATLTDGSEPDMFVRLQSWDEARKHGRASEFGGKKVRVTVEVLP